MEAQETDTNIDFSKIFKRFHADSDMICRTIQTMHPGKRVQKIISILTNEDCRISSKHGLFLVHKVKRGGSDEHLYTIHLESFTGGSLIGVSRPGDKGVNMERCSGRILDHIRNRLSQMQFSV